MKPTTKHHRARATMFMRTVWPALKKNIDNWLGITEGPDPEIRLKIIPKDAWSEGDNAYILIHQVNSRDFKMSLVWRIEPKHET